MRTNNKIKTISISDNKFVLLLNYLFKNDSNNYENLKNNTLPINKNIIKNYINSFNNSFNNYIDINYQIPYIEIFGKSYNNSGLKIGINSYTHNESIKFSDVYLISDYYFYNQETKKYYFT